MSELSVCRICLRTEAKMYHFNLYQLKCYYEEVMALKMNEMDGLPQYFCYECATILHKFHKFKEKCYRGQNLLREMLWRGPITYELIYKIDRINTKIISPLQVISSSERIRTYTAKDSTETNETFEVNAKVEQKLENIELEYFSKTSLTEQEILEPRNNFDHEETVMDGIETYEEEHLNDECDKKDIQPLSPSAVYVEGDKGIIKIKCEEIKGKKLGRGDKWKQVLNSNHWKSFILSEEEALKAFRAKAECRRYVDAAYKCTDCFKGFSKKDMLDRHKQLRHVETLGPYVCRFCRLRYKLSCYLRKHMQQHYTRFECLRCQFVCHLENSAFLHNEYHSGITRKCVYCDEEFRHSSTYYTHLRTHRSQHVCTLCGISFVSKAGLHQHKRIKHVINDIESPDDDEEVNTYCERCDITFETRKAYEEHLFHSALHSDGEDNYAQKNNRKILGKKEQAKITKQLRKRSADEDLFKRLPTNGLKRKKKCRRKHRKPTTCHQCGKHFDTQAACWAHHLSEHPRTSFYAPTERYICEICGSSLAPGSIATHQNMHTREKLHTCDTCGRQFHAIVGLRRHMVTHTGEKPYACTLCDKRFTQSNSMKLHYRTFHLKEPYPKRNRRKNKGEPKTADADNTNSEEESDDSLPDMEPELPERDAGVEPVTDALPDKPSDENMHYLTLT